jgi:hypothetical protein
MLTLLPKGVKTKYLNLFWWQIVSICHKCQRHQWCTLSCEFSNKFESALLEYSRAWGKLIYEKTWRRKSSGIVPSNYKLNQRKENYEVRRLSVSKRVFPVVKSLFKYFSYKFYLWALQDYLKKYLMWTPSRIPFSVRVEVTGWLYSWQNEYSYTRSRSSTNRTGLHRGLQRDAVYLGWPIASLYCMSPNRQGGGGSCGLSKKVKLYVHRSPNKLWRSN